MRKILLGAAACALLAMSVGPAAGTPAPEGPALPEAEAHSDERVVRGDMSVMPPPRGRTVVLEVIRENGAVDMLSVSRRHDGSLEIVYESGGEPTDESADEVAVAATPIPPCSDSTYNLSSWRASPPPYFLMNFDVMAPGVTQSMLRDAVVNAATNIVTARNDCGMPDYVDATNIVTPGTTTMRTNFYRRADGWHDCTFDGYSVIEMGYLYRALASGCHYLETDGSMIAFDMRFDKDRKWFTGSTAPTGCHKDTNPYYDLEGVATHEMGHLYGLGHAGPAGGTYEEKDLHNLLTMNNWFRRGQICKTEYRTLGRGDVLGLEQKY